MKARGYCFTINNYTNEDIENLTKLAEKTEYTVAGLEKGSEKETPHIQGYIYFKNAVSFNTIKESLPRAHIEKAHGNAEQNRNYCLKDGITLIEHGNMPKQGERTDLKDIKDLVKTGHRMKDIIEEAQNYQSLRSAELLYKYIEKQRDWKPIVKWFYGKSGTGKTYTAIQEAGPDYWISDKDLQWWNNYDGHENIIIDDFRDDYCKLHELLRILDRYPYRVQNKGGSRQLLAKNIWITCPYHPDKYYRGIEDSTQLLRRIDEIREFTDNDFGTKVLAQKSGVILNPDKKQE